MTFQSNRLALLTRVDLPQQGAADVRDVTGAGVRWGPYAVGTILRVTCAVGNVWYIGGGSDVAAVSRSRGAPLAAWDRSDHEITSSDARYVHVVNDSASQDAFAVVYEAGRSDEIAS